MDKGVVDGGYAWTHYWSGKNSAAALFSNPAAGAGTGMDQMSHMSWLFQGGGNALYEKLYEQGLKVNIKPFMMQPMGPDPFGWFKTPINSIADMKKLKYRSPPGLTGEIFKEMGINAVAMPGGEIVPAAQRGVIDAAEWIGPADDMILGFHNVFKNYYLQGLHQSSDIGELLINKTVWNKLTPDLKAVVEAAVMATIAETYTYNVHRNAVALQKLVQDHKVVVQDTPKEFFTAFLKATNVVYDREAERNPLFKEVLQSQRAFAKTVVPYWTKINGLYYKLKALAVTTAKRSSTLPNVPTLQEAGVPNLAIGTWFGLLAPAATPKPVIARLNTEIVKIIQSPEFKKQMADIGAEPVGNKPEEMAKQIKEETEKFARLVKDGKITLE